MKLVTQFVFAASSISGIKLTKVNQGGKIYPAFFLLLYLIVKIKTSPGLISRSLDVQLTIDDDLFGCSP